MVTLLSKLALNAVEHGAVNKVVRVALRAVDDAAVIEIASAGPALEDETVGRLFEPFNCGHSRRLDGLEGLGLGLYLANEIARAHAGRIDAWSDLDSGNHIPRDDAAFVDAPPGWSLGF